MSRILVMKGFLLNDNNPIRSLASYGQWMIGIGWSVWGISVAAKAAADGVGESVLGLAGAGAFSSIAEQLMTMVLVLVAFLIGTGAFLAYYLPVIPFIYWVMAVLGWVIMVAQSLLAAPLWAASHAVPEGDGFAGRYALQGWQLLLNVVTRPILLTLGLLISMFVMQAIAFFALKGYSVFNDTLISTTVSSTAITGIVVTNLIMASIVIVLAHKAHELIYDLADDIMKWIGFGTSPLGSVKAEGDVRHMSQAGTRATGQMAQAAAGQGGGGARPRGGGTGGGGGGDNTNTSRDANPAGGNPAPERSGAQKPGW